MANCAGGQMSSMKFGKRCTVSDTNQLQESSYVWFVSKDAIQDFDKRFEKCLTILDLRRS